MKMIENLGREPAPVLPPELQDFKNKLNTVPGSEPTAKDLARRNAEAIEELKHPFGVIIQGSPRTAENEPKPEIF